MTSLILTKAPLGAEPGIVKAELLALGAAGREGASNATSSAIVLS